MGDNEVRCGNGIVVKIKEIDVDRSRTISRRTGSSAEIRFDCLQFSKKLLRLQVGRKLECRVEEMRRIRRAVHGRRFVNL